MKRKRDKKNLTFPDGDLNPGFLNKFPPKFWMIFDIIYTRSWLGFAQKHISNIIEEIVSDKSRKLQVDFRAYTAVHTKPPP